jgi:fatty-acid peroxygenase
MAVVKEDFNWEGFVFEEGNLTLLDLYGTNHDPNLWGNPDLFKPDRFTSETVNVGFIPQSAREYFLGHRCAGEWLTIEAMKVSLDYLVN